MMRWFIVTLFILVGTAFSDKKSVEIPLKFGRFNKDCLYVDNSVIFACHEFNLLMKIPILSPTQFEFIKNSEIKLGITAIDGFNDTIYVGFTDGSFSVYNLKLNKIIYKGENLSGAIKLIQVERNGEFWIVSEEGQIKYFVNFQEKSFLNLKHRFLHLTKTEKSNEFIGISQNWNGAIQINHIKIDSAGKLIKTRKNIKINTKPETLYSYYQGQIFVLTKNILSTISIEIGEVIKSETILAFKDPVAFGNVGEKMFVAEKEGDVIFANPINFNILKREALNQQIQTLLEFDQKLFVFGFENLIIK